MNSEDLYNTVSSYCASGKSNKVKNTLDDNVDTEITFESYQEFLGIAMAHGRVEMLKILLDHYEKTKLQDDLESISYKYARSKLLTILQEEYDSCFVNEETQKILDGFGINENNDEDTDREEDFEDLESYSTITSEASNSDNSGSSGELPLTCDNLRELQEELSLAGDHFESMVMIP